MAKSKEIKPIIEDKITFNEFSDLRSITVIDSKSDQSAVEISGYLLNVKFNMNIINSSEDIDKVTSGIAESFKDILVNQLAEKN